MSSPGPADTKHNRAPDDALTRQMRISARDIFHRSLAQATVEKAFDRHLHCERGVLRICDDLYDLSRYPQVVVISIGKAAYSMLNALHAHIGERATGVAVGPTEAEEELPGFQYICGGHPVPTHGSVRAASAILKALEKVTPSALVVFLMSGGGSAVAEKPIVSGMTLEDLAATYQPLVLSGGTIAEINAIRKHLSAIKGGRLARAAAPAQQVSILVSDVPDNALDALASGPTMPDSSTVAECFAIADRYRLLEQFPEPVRSAFQNRKLEETPKQGDQAFAHSRWWTVLSNSVVLQAAAAEAGRAGFAVEVDNSCDDWDYTRAADYLLERLRKLREGVSRVALVSGGEVTVSVENGGKGGRNQQFALYCAEKIRGENITILSAGTDGIDGNSLAAGAVVDGTTVARAQQAGLDVARGLASFDSYPLLNALGDTVIIGPTGNNLRDVRLMIAY